MCTCTPRAPTSKCLVIYCSTSYPFFISVMVHTFSLCLRFFFFHQTIFSPHIWSRCSILHSFACSLDTVFSSVAGFCFWIEPDQFTARQRYSLCVHWRGKAVREIGRVCFMMAIIGTHKSYFQLSFLVIIATAMAPLCCLFSSKADTWLWMLKLLLASILACSLPCFTHVHPCIQVKNLQLQFYKDLWFFSMKAWLLIVRHELVLIWCSIYRFGPYLMQYLYVISKNFCMQSVLFLFTQTTSTIQLRLYATRHMCLCASRQTAENDFRSLSFCV